MKKPDYIEIRLPGRKSTFVLAKRRYLKAMEGKIINVNFGRERERKLFEYLVLESSPEKCWNWHSELYEMFWKLKLELKVPKSDQEKVP